MIEIGVHLCCNCCTVQQSLPAVRSSKCNCATVDLMVGSNCCTVQQLQYDFILEIDSKRKKLIVISTYPVVLLTVVLSYETC